MDIRRVVGLGMTLRLSDSPVIPRSSSLCLVSFSTGSGAWPWMRFQALLVRGLDI